MGSTSKLADRGDYSQMRARRCMRHQAPRTRCSDRLAALSRPASTVTVCSGTRRSTRHGARIAGCRVMGTIRNLVTCIGLAWLIFATPTTVAAQLRDGTIVHVRLVSPITSENAKAGDSLPFVVTRDVVVDGAVVIARKTPAAGLIVAARRANWGFIYHRPLLSFAFVQTMAVD